MLLQPYFTQNGQNSRVLAILSAVGLNMLFAKSDSGFHCIDSSVFEAD